MHTRKGNIATVLLILFSIIQSIGLIYNYNIELHRHNEHSNENLSAKKNQFISLTFKEWSLVRKVNKDEILLNGKMFDVKSITYKQNNVLVYGHFDSKEDQLLSKSRDANSKKNELQKTVKISILYCDELLDYSVKPIYYIVDSKKQFLQSELININLPIEIPPPEFV